MRGEDEAELDGLMTRLAAGERDAFDPLFRALYPRALRLARFRLAESDAEDAAQAAMEKVFARANEFSPGRAVMPWFYGVAGNEIHGIVRRKVHRGGDGTELANVRAAEDPERELVREELRSIVRQAMDLLDPPSLAAICALLGEGEPPAIAAPAFRKRVSRAYARLRLLLGGYRAE